MQSLNIQARSTILLLLALSLIVAGCADSSPTPDPNGPVLVGFADLPKSLATIYFSPTPNPTEVQATVTRIRPTNTPAVPTFTPSPLPNNGIFMGASTFATGVGILPTGTGGVPYVIITPGPGTKLPTVVPVVGLPAGTPPPVIAISPIPVGSPSACPVQPAAQFAKAAQNATVQQRLGCPTAPPQNLNLVVQPFQNGFMFWRDTKEIYVLSTAALKTSPTDTFWRYQDTWTESIPPSDPSLTPPSGLLQPVRGFGYLWRSNPNIKNTLGWALAPEQSYPAVWQTFEHGWMMTGNNNTVFALVPSDGPPPTTGIHFGPMPQ